MQRLAEACTLFIEEYVKKHFSKIIIQQRNGKTTVLFAELLYLNQEHLSMLFEWLNIYYERKEEIVRLPSSTENFMILINEITIKLIIKIPFSFIVQNEVYANKLNKNLKYFINFNYIKYLENKYFSLNF